MPTFGAVYGLHQLQYGQSQVGQFIVMISFASSLQTIIYQRKKRKTSYSTEFVKLVVSIRIYMLI